MKIGEAVKSNTRIYRKKYWKSEFKDGSWEGWSKNTWESINDPVTGIYIGYRHLTDGVADGHGNYTPSHRFKAALIVQNEKENPIRVRFEDMDVA